MTESPARAKKAEIDHVVVLMLENRSFDNLLGFLDYPGMSPLKVGSHPNPFEADGHPPQKATVSEDAEFSLPVDPPHSHASVMRQINGRPKARMNGFAAEYYKKASGNEDLPVVRWDRVEGVALFLGAAVAAIAIAADTSPLVAHSPDSRRGRYSLSRGLPVRFVRLSQALEGVFRPTPESLAGFQ